MLTDRVRAWQQAGQSVEFRGHRIHVHRRDGAGPSLVLLHGFPSSSYDFRGLLDALPGRAALTVDFLGFGLSDKPRDHDYTLDWQADLTEHLAGSGPVQLVGHDMGLSVATELMARDIDGRARTELAGVLLFNGSLLQDLASLTISQKLLAGPLGGVFARLSSARTFRAQFARLFSDDHPLSAEEAADQWSLIAHNGGNRITHRTIAYMDERRRKADRWHGAFRDWPGPLRLAWGLRDPVATTALLDALRELRPDVPVTELPDLAHYPQIEAPERIAAAIA